MIPEAAVEAAVPRITSWLDRSGLVLRNKEAAGLARYILEAAAPHMESERVEALKHDLARAQAALRNERGTK